MNKIKSVATGIALAFTLTVAPAAGVFTAGAAQATPTISVQAAKHCGVKRIPPTLPAYHPACWNLFPGGGSRDPRCSWRTVPDCR